MFLKMQLKTVTVVARAARPSKQYRYKKETHQEMR